MRHEKKVKFKKKIIQRQKVIKNKKKRLEHAHYLLRKMGRGRLRKSRNNARAKVV